MTKDYKYTYKVEQHTVDVRYYTVQSDVKLTEEKCREKTTEVTLTNGSEHVMKNSKVKFHGIEYGADTQIIVHGEVKED